MREDVFKLKGSRGGLQLVFDKSVPFDTLYDDIDRRLQTDARFFKRGTVVHLLPNMLSLEDEKKLRKLFHRYGVLFSIEKQGARPKHHLSPDVQKISQSVSGSASSSGQVNSPVPEEQQMIVINRTLRSGQEVQTQGSVLICGNVNPGAEIVAGGSIDIRGTCRGIIHAGAYGDRTAFVIADRLMPIQIRIADLIAQAPDTIEKPSYAERASIKNDQIVIEPIER